MSLPDRRHVQRTVPERPVYIDIKPDNGGIVLNVSDQGLCFHSVAPIEEHQPIAFSFFERDRAIDAVGDIVWIDKSRKFGGVRFSLVSPEARGKILELLNAASIDDEEAIRQLSLFLGENADVKVIPFPQISQPALPPETVTSSHGIAPAETQKAQPITTGQLAIVDRLPRLPMPILKRAWPADRPHKSPWRSKVTEDFVRAISSRAITIALLVAAVLASISLSRENRLRSDIAPQSVMPAETNVESISAPPAAQPAIKRISLAPPTLPQASSVIQVHPFSEVVVIKSRKPRESHRVVPGKASLKEAPQKPLPLVSAVPVAFNYPAVSNPSLSGKVELKVQITQTGSVQGATVVSGNQTLARASVRAVRGWHYRPVQIDGQAVDAETNVSFRFAGNDAVSVNFH